MELWRAARLVVDTGIHHKRWTREQAIEWLKENTPNPIGDIEKGIERYIVYPGQATAYMIGKLKIMELREEARAKLGDERSEEHTSELQSLMRISYAVFCLKKKQTNKKLKTN